MEMQAPGYANDSATQATVELHRDASSPMTEEKPRLKNRRKHLVVVRAGESSLHPAWLEGAGQRSWDLIVHSYGAECPWSDEEGVEVIRATGADIVGPKMRAMHSLYERRKSDLLAYDYVCFADDDLAVSLESFNLMFSMCEQFALELAQPALTHDSHMGNWGITMENRSFLLRYTNFVEVMCPVFSRAFLERCAPTFVENMSGYGLDFLWSSWVSSPWKIAILDACPVKHTRASYSGQLYQTLAERGVSPDRELIDLIKKWNLVKPAEQVPGQVVVPTALHHGGILRDRTRIATCEGEGMALLAALLRGFPAELKANHAQVMRLLYPTMQQTVSHDVRSAPSPASAPVEKKATPGDPATLPQTTPASNAGTRVSYLNLDRSPERLASFLKFNSHLTNVHRVAAVDGSTFSRKDLQAAKVIEGEMADYTDGALGCALSHLCQWEIASRGQEPITLGEDDAIFHHRFEQLASRVLASLPADWDIIQWGWNFDSILAFDLLPGVSHCVGAFDQAGLRANVTAYQALALNPIAYRLQRSLGTVCQSISAAGAAKLLRHCLPIRKMETFYPLLNRTLPNKGIDNMMNELYPRINAYVCIPPLVITKNEHELSTVQIQGR
jgi:GR25 family glycosyltransferase involved in LPS biosynthesis